MFYYLVKRFQLKNEVDKIFLLCTSCDYTNNNTFSSDYLSFTVKKVKHFELHPNYNISAKVNQGVKEFYDYDVALIQLEEHVDFSPVIR